jgi:hypothetical protein
MNIKQRIAIMLVLVMSWIVSGCGASSTLPPASTITPLPPTKTPVAGEKAAVKTLEILRGLGLLP